MGDNDERISQYIEDLRNMTQAEFEKLYLARYPDPPQEEHNWTGNLSALAQCDWLLTDRSLPAEPTLHTPATSLKPGTCELRR